MPMLHYKHNHNVSNFDLKPQIVRVKDIISKMTILIKYTQIKT